MADSAVTSSVSAVGGLENTGGRRTVRRGGRGGAPGGKLHRADSDPKLPAPSTGLAPDEPGGNAAGAPAPDKHTGQNVGPAPADSQLQPAPASDAEGLLGEAASAATHAAEVLGQSPRQPARPCAEHRASTDTTPAGA